MKITSSFNPIIIPVILCLLFCSSCYTRQELEYYADESNFISASGVVTHMKYSEDGSELYLAFSDLSYKFDDSNFKIVGASLETVWVNGIDEKIRIGDRVEFMAAPAYLGDGYVIPIAAISAHGETLLEFEQGFEDLQVWLRE